MGSEQLVHDIWAAVEALRRPQPAQRPVLLAVVTDGPRHLPVIREQVALLTRRCFDHGWLPYECVRHVSRTFDDAVVTAFAAIVGAEGDRAMAAHHVDPRWAASATGLAELRRSLHSPGEPGVVAWLELLGVLRRLPDLAVIVPPPGAPAAPRAGRPVAGGSLDARQIERVRALLAKAESTTFSEEAEALTAKAQELIARHSLDHALRAAASRDRRPDGEQPIAVRFWLDDPYADAKSFLLFGVASANRCRGVWHAELSVATVLGYEHDLAAVELLFTSLLAQATGAMARHGAVRDEVGRSRTRSFRRSFLLGFAQRITERLREVSTAQEAELEASSGGALVPVLAHREEQVEAVERSTFPHLVTRRATAITNAAGWRAGRVAAELARLGPDGPGLRAG